MASCACDGITFRVVSFCNLIDSSKFGEVTVDRKYTESLPGPFPDFSGGAWGRGDPHTRLVLRYQNMIGHISLHVFLGIGCTDQAFVLVWKLN